MSTRSNTTSGCAVAEVCAALESIAPTGLAQGWDNVGLLAGDPLARVQRVVACIDLTHGVAREAAQAKAGLVVAYHPPIFKPVLALRSDSTDTDAVVHECIRNGIAIYATHTALDAAEGGTNDVIASLCGVKDTEPIEYVESPSVDECKLVVFVPQNQIHKVAKAMFDAGAGNIGDYTHCSYRIAGQGTFFGTETTSPSIGQRGGLEHVDEMRMETVVPSKVLPRVVTAMLKVHPYEEPAFDIYPLRPRPVRGIGRVGGLARKTSLATLARKLKRATSAASPQIVGPPERTVERAIIVVGAAGTLPFRIPLGLNDVIITGEIRHHDALAIDRHGCTAIALGHWASEHPVLESLVHRLQAMLPGVSVTASESDKDPFRPV